MRTLRKIDWRSLALFPFGAIMIVALTPFDFYRKYTLVFEFENIFRPALVLVAMTLTTYLLARVLTHNLPWARLLTVSVAAAILCLGPVHLALILIATMLVCMIFARERAGDAASALTNIIAVSVLVSTAVTNPRFPAARPVEAEGSVALRDLSLRAKPSIVHIVLDGYGSSDTLKRIYGIDNEPFIDALEARGFTVFDPAVVPYSQTLFSLGSIMNGGYISIPTGSAGRSRIDAGASISTGPVASVLGSSGYHLYDNMSGYSIIRRDQADTVGARFWRPTALEGVMLRRIPYATEMSHNQALRDTLGFSGFSGLERPFHYWQHVLAPHPPFSVEADGSVRRISTEYLEDGSHAIRGSESRRRDYIKGYTAKLKFLNEKLLEQFDHIPRDAPIVVILHGDHGPGAFMEYENPAESCAKERLSTLLAVYSNVPEVRVAFEARGAESYNIVNIYRTLFAALSDRDIPDLLSRSEFLPWSRPSDGRSLSTQEVMAACPVGSNSSKLISLRTLKHR